ncbi:MAG: NAD-dependent deacetylase [Desulfotomaculaceae bacterium]|nr:NAD-dependent deacetylase [Desulfotomaculaceae bacterium]MDD4767865.1 NAD-dependent deacetylase [Desulfotomaculaceae bacterium]
MENQKKCEDAASIIKSARALVVTAGAGMGVDSGLPDFRGNKGFWNAYPMYERLGINFVEAANPSHFAMDPAFGWGFYGHRANLYRDASPHAGFQIILDWISRYNLDYFVATSNVDGHFQRAGYAEDRVYEVHGSIQYMQCLTPCSDDIWKNDEIVEVDLDSMRARHIPKCPHCGNTARPNILMFGDFSWLSERSDRQSYRFNHFLYEHRDENLVVVEIGAGTGVPTIRRMSEHIGDQRHVRVIRINLREPEIGRPHISIPCAGLEALRTIDKALKL